eukprot:jgi/Bigna1/83194/fgenesh1_pg.103_\
MAQRLAVLAGTVAASVLATYRCHRNTHANRKRVCIRRTKPTKVILVVVAMEVELQAILRVPAAWNTVQIAGGYELFVCESCQQQLDFLESVGKNEEVAGAEKTTVIGVVQSGIGNVAGALAAQAVMLGWGRKIDAVVSLGVAGALQSDLLPGDVMLATRILKHDCKCSSSESESELMRPGELWVSNPDRHLIDPGICLDEELVSHTLALFRKAKMHIRVGTLASGDEFVMSIASLELRERKIAQQHQQSSVGAILMVDMESGGIVQAVHRMKTSFVAIRTVADTLKPKDGIEDSYKCFKEVAAKVAATYVRLLMEESGATKIT